MAAQDAGVAPARRHAARTAAALLALLTAAGGAAATAAQQSPAPPPLPDTTPTPVTTPTPPAEQTPVPASPTPTPSPALVPLLPSAAAPATPPRPAASPAASPPSVTPPSGGKTPEPENTLHLDHADRFHEEETGAERGVFIAEGHVRFTYQGSVVTCDRATFDPRSHVATLQSNVVLDTGTQTVYAEHVSLNLRTREFAAREARSVVPQQYLGPNVLQPLRLSGGEVTHSGDVTTARDGLLTTCDFPDPHYKIGFRRATIIEGKRISLADAVFYDSRGKAVARVRYLSIPISRQVRYTYLPQVGRTDEEGYYVKTAVGYTGSKQLPDGILRVDAMQKKGVGLGIDQAYKLGRDAVGTFILYSLNDRSRNVNNLNGRINHQERFGPTLLTIASDFQNNSYTSVSPESKSALTTITANRTVGPSTTNLSLNLGSSSFSGLSASRNTAYSIQQTENFGQAANVTFHFTGSRNESDSGVLSSGGGFGTSNVRTEELGDIRATGRAGIFDLSLTANKNFLSRSVNITTDSSTGARTESDANYFSGTERLPDLALTTDSSRLGGFLKAIPAQFTFGWGELIDGPPTARIDTDRSLFDATLTPRPISLTRGGYLSLTENGGFRQILYSRQNAAQYILTDQTVLTQKFSSIDSLNFTYGYLRPYGGEPTGFYVDQSGSNNNLGMNYTLNGGSAKLTLLTGYDLERAGEHNLPEGVARDPWQNLSAQLAVRASDKIQTRFTGTYDWNHGRLLDATNRFRYHLAGGPSLDTTLRFDPRTRKFPQVTGALLTPLFRSDLNLAAYAGYNGVSYRWDYRQFALTKSYHDYEITLGYIDQPYGFRTQKGFNFSIRLKAFPSFSQQAGGQFGTAIDTGSGPVF